MKILDDLAGKIPGATEMQVRDALRLALQASVAGAATWLAMEAIGMNERFVGILSACLVMKATLGSTLVAGIQRVIATVVGCLLGLLCLFAIPYGYGTAVAIAIPVAVVGLVAGFKPEWRYGLVGAIALGIGAEGNLLEVATDRCLSIALGVVVGNLCALGIFPEKSSMRSERHLRLALKAIGDFLESAASRIDSREEADTSRPGANSGGTSPVPGILRMG